MATRFNIQLPVLVRESSLEDLLHEPLELYVPDATIAEIHEQISRPRQNLGGAGPPGRVD